MIVSKPTNKFHFRDKDELVRTVITDRMIEKAVLSPFRKLLIGLSTIFYVPKIVPIGVFSLDGWRGRSLFYLFECCRCGRLSVDYAHGYKLRLICPFCGLQVRLNHRRFYRENNMERPLEAAISPPVEFLAI